jgi:hypothetical protein
MQWTSALDDSMRQAVASGVSYGAFVAANALSRNSVLGRALRLRRAGISGFEIRESAAVDKALLPHPQRERHDSPRSEDVIKPRKEPKVRLKSLPLTWQPEYARMAGAPLWDRVSPDRIGLRRDLVDLRQNECRWIAADGTYCGHAIHSRSCCAFHFGVVYQIKRSGLPAIR